MSAEALPFTLLILSVELAVGSIWVLWAAHLRGTAADSFIKFSAGMIVVLAGIASLVAATIGVGAETDGYPLDPDAMPAARAFLLLFFLLSVPYTVLAMRGARVPALFFGGCASVAGFVALAFVAQVFAIPTWGYALTLLSLAVGALVVGAVTLGMTLGHWYLVTPRLPEQPLREMTFWLLVIMGFQAVLITLALILPRDDIANAVDTPIVQNPFFWMRVGGGLLFPMLLVWMAWDSSRVRAMQSATGLLYIAMALVLAGEALGKGLLFVSAVPN